MSITSETNDADLKSFILTCEFENETEDIMIASVLIDIEAKTLALNKYFGEQVYNVYCK
jgi:hypothetical protein